MMFMTTLNIEPKGVPMKQISKMAALSCAVALLPLGAVAQEDIPAWLLEETNGDAASAREYQEYEEEFPEPGMSEIPEMPEPPEWGETPEWEETSYGSSEPRSQRDTAVSDLPPPGVEVSLDGYDKMMAGLTKDIDARLQQLSLKKGDGDLPDPNTAAYNSIMEQIAEDQREIKLLESKIAKAKLAKELWSELNTDDRDELLAEVETLRAANAELEAAALAREEELQAEAQQAAARVAELELDLEMAEMAAIAASQDGGANGTGSDPLGGSGSGSAGSSFAMMNPPLVEAIIITAGRRAARISTEGGNIRSYGIGESLGAEIGVIESIDHGGVRVRPKEGDIFTLERGTYRTAPAAPAASSSSGSGGSSEELDMENFEEDLFYLDEVTEFANE
jgi:hypothetical protein